MPPRRNEVMMLVLTVEDLLAALPMKDAIAGALPGQDAVAAVMAFRNAKTMGLGLRVRL